MSAGNAAEVITLTSDEVKKRIAVAVTSVLRERNPTITEGSVAKALFAGCAIVCTVGNVLRVPTKDDVATRVAENNDKKKPRLNGVGERQSTAKVLNSEERLKKGAVHDAAKSDELRTKEAKENEKLERRQLEFPLLQKCKELALTAIVPHSKAGHVYSLLKGELVALLMKMGLESDCEKCTKKKHNNFNRTELRDYLLSKIKNSNGSFRA